MCGQLGGDIAFGDGTLSAMDVEDSYVTSRSVANASAEWSILVSGEAVVRDMSIDSVGNSYVAGWLNGVGAVGGSTITAAGTYDAFVAKIDPAGDVKWVDRFGASGATVRALAVAADKSDGGVVFAGTLNGAVVSFGGGGLNPTMGDFFIAKMNANGQHMWSKNPGPTTTAISGQPLAMASAPSGGVALASTFSGSIDLGGGLWSDSEGAGFVVVLDALGGHVWSRQLAARPHALAFGDSGQLALVATFDGTVDVGGGQLTAAASGSVLAAMFDQSGGHLWSRALAASSSTDIPAATLDANGNLLFAGRILSPADFGGGLFEPDGEDAFVVKLAGSDGTHLWSHQFGDGGAPETQKAGGVAVTPQGVFVAGDFLNMIDVGSGMTATANGDEDVFLVQLSP